MVGQLGFAAIRAFDRIGGLKPMMRTAHIAHRFRSLLFRYSHDTSHKKQRASTGKRMNERPFLRKLVGNARKNQFLNEFKGARGLCPRRLVLFGLIFQGSQLGKGIFWFVAIVGGFFADGIQARFARVGIKGDAKMLGDKLA